MVYITFPAFWPQLHQRRNSAQISVFSSAAAREFPPRKHVPPASPSAKMLCKIRFLCQQNQQNQHIISSTLEQHDFYSWFIKVGQIFVTLWKSFVSFLSKLGDLILGLFFLWNSSSQFGRVKVGLVLETGTPPRPPRVTSISDCFVRWPTFPPKKNSEKKEAAKNHITSGTKRRTSPYSLSRPPAPCWPPFLHPLGAH